MKFHVSGLPVPQGSKKAIPHKSTGRIILIDQSGKRLKEWRNAVAAEAARHSEDYLYEGAVSVEVTFRMKLAKKPPPAHSEYPIMRPDIDKLTRAILDSLTSTVFVDDSQVCRLTAHKRYALDGEQPGVDVEVWAL